MLLIETSCVVVTVLHLPLSVLNTLEIFHFKYCNVSANLITKQYYIL